MKKLMSLGAVALFALSLASCQTCYDCNWEFLGVNQTQELCSGDGVSKSELEESVDALEALGWDCVKR